jgi:NAD-dependent DNA ligase
LYDIDGIIITDNNKHERNIDGNPKYSIAFKELLEDQIVETEVTDVEWRVSKDGLIKPRVHVKPTIIGGITIVHVTGHNAKNVVDNGIGIGAKIKLTRAGEVIPYIVEVIKKVKPTLPKITYKWNETKVDYIVDKDNLGENESNDILVKNLTYFFKKMEIKYVDESIIRKMINVGLDNITSIIEAKVEDFLEIDGFKEKMATKIYSNIQNAIKDVDITKVMTASNLFGHGLGSKKLALILKSDPNILKVKLSKNKFIEKIKEIDGFDVKTASQFVENIEKFNKFLEKNKKIKIKVVTKDIKSNGKFKNLKFIFTGFRDKELENIIEKEGGTLSSAVSGNTDFVITIDKDSDSSKVTKAKSLGIKILTKLELINKFKINYKEQNI